MEDEYDLSSMRSRRNPYFSKLARQVTLELGPDVVDYFERMADETGESFSSLVNVYLRDCVLKQRRLDFPPQ